MARGRMISKSLGASKRFTDLQTYAGKLGEFSAALFCLVVSNCDDFGRLEGDAASVKWRCWPASLRSEHDFAVAVRPCSRQSTSPRRLRSSAEPVAWSSGIPSSI